ncbi:hypothetical protein AB0E27_20315 [Streptomyces sparsogenes]|uniref:hypothetical protein n=1 Tax=Streptomyces sparsogenes TaxID=67365 RepID=UPI0033C8A345
MSVRDELLAEYGRADTAPLGTLAELRQKLDVLRTEVLAEAKAEVVAWLGKKAREYRSTGGAQHALQAEAINTMASKVDRGAIRLFLDDAGKVTPTGGEITQPAELTIYRASHESIVMGLYTTAAAARAHCEADMRRDLPSVSLDWIEDEEDGVAELVASVGEEERPTGFVVTALEVASAYDEEADE